MQCYPTQYRVNQVHYTQFNKPGSAPAMKKVSTADYYEKKLQLEQKRNAMIERAVLGFGCFAAAIAISQGCIAFSQLGRILGKVPTKTKENEKGINTITNIFKSLIEDKTIPTLDNCKSLNNDLKVFLQNQVDFIRADNEVVKEIGASLPNRLIISGPPGSGKSFFAKILAKTLNADYMEVKISDIKTKWVGESLENFKSIFEGVIKEAKKSPNKKFVVTLNEIDAFLQPVNRYAHTAQGSGTHWITKMEERATFLSYIEKLQYETPNVIVIGTTNISPRNNGLDGAAVSRFQKVLEIELPNKDLLFEALKSHIEKLNYGTDFIKSNEDKLKKLASDMEKNKYSFRNLDNLYECSKNYYLKSKLENKNSRFEFSYLEDAFNNHGLSDGKIVS